MAGSHSPPTGCEPPTASPPSAASSSPGQARQLSMEMALASPGQARPSSPRRAGCGAGADAAPARRSSYSDPPMARLSPPSVDSIPAERDWLGMASAGLGLARPSTPSEAPGAAPAPRFQAGRTRSSASPLPRAPPRPVPRTRVVMMKFMALLHNFPYVSLLVLLCQLPAAVMSFRLSPSTGLSLFLLIFAVVTFVVVLILEMMPVLITIPMQSRGDGRADSNNVPMVALPNPQPSAAALAAAATPSPPPRTADIARTSTGEFVDPELEDSMEPSGPAETTSDTIVPAKIEIVVEGDSNTVAATEATSVYYVPFVPREQEIQEIEEIEEIHEIQELGKIRQAGLEKIDEIEEIEEGQGGGAYCGHDYGGYRGHTYAPRLMIRNSYSTWTSYN